LYLYFLPLKIEEDSSTHTLPSLKQALIPVPTSDGGLEHTAAQFLPPKEWLSLAQSGSIVLFPPQFFLISLLSPLLSPAGPGEQPRQELESQRNSVLGFLKTGNPPWGEKCIGPQAMSTRVNDGVSILSLEKPGRELEGTGRKGDDEFVILVEMTKEGPRNLKVRRRQDLLEEIRGMESPSSNL
jgi:hypothetical protein